MKDKTDSMIRDKVGFELGVDGRFRSFHKDFYEPKYVNIRMRVYWPVSYQMFREHINWMMKDIYDELPKMSGRQ